MSMTSWENRSQPDRMESSINSRINNLQIFTGFEKDWFDRADLKKRFKAKYGYELGVPVNWSAYEDIADFSTNDVKNIDGVRVYGHMDYGKRAPRSWVAHD